MVLREFAFQDDIMIVFGWVVSKNKYPQKCNLYSSAIYVLVDLIMQFWVSAIYTLVRLTALVLGAC